ncbi:50S ribosomal protein L10 [Candidatus Woesearchaeota archaeon]|nr:50S ribosomal protein L10 [Candidatus Woesearchaeota archaeon]MBW3006328.1 50S ribosomal protein L10 [Candidatus Woesearchaeota archaeon]
MSEKTSRAAPKKKNVVKKVQDLIKQYPIIGVVNMENLPTPQLQRMREQLRGKVDLLMTKRRLILKAMDTVKDKPGFDKLKEIMRGMPALLFTKENPFTLFKTLKQNKSKAPAKAGQTAPSDIIVPAGPTPFAPGPVIGELGALGIKASVEGGKIAIKSDTKVCSEGDVISEKLAGMLTRLGIEPMEIGLDLLAVYEDGTIYPKSVLDVDEEKFMGDLMLSASQAHELAMQIGYATPDTIEPMIQRTYRAAKTIAKEGKFMADEVAAEMVEQAEREMLALKGQLPEVKAEEKKEEPKAEEKPAEAPKEEKPAEKPKEEKKEEAPKEEPKKEEKPAEAPKEEEPKEEKPHPKQGDVSQEQAKDLLKNLQEKGTLREEKS